ncbi:hypothetical protein TNIN_459211 [Trichonephila inaurata madagascariensis]|uniref:Uncharacterized protein n=1 Tax=Trichonephila inaurata madagascariensis TaxID=2747483 RepID=A0A8X7CPG0_9ARAC|nr:hypothetical protein TNIN_459211 [Trichonephila inaurata madagascariensis]
MGTRLRRLSTEIRDAEIQGIFPPVTELSEPDDADWLSYGHISSRLRKLVPDKVPYPLLIGLADVMIVSALIALAAVSYGGPRPVTSPILKSVCLWRETDHHPVHHGQCRNPGNHQRLN